VFFVLNDPLNLGLPTLDAKGSVSPTCTTFDWAAFQFNALVFLVVWWGPHSLLARASVKKALGLHGTALDRPLFAAIAPFTWLYTLLSWKPIDTCARFNILTDVSPVRHIVSAVLFAFWNIELLGLFYLLPNHVFGTDLHTWPDGKQPKGKPEIIWTFPYGLVRHPAAAFFLWAYWIMIPNYTTNHIVLASFWTVFILLGTLVFEEGGLRGDEEFGPKYLDYASKVNPFWPSLWSIKRLFSSEKVKAK